MRVRTARVTSYLHDDYKPASTTGRYERDRPRALVFAIVVLLGRLSPGFSFVANHYDNVAVYRLTAGHAFVGGPDRGESLTRLLLLHVRLQC